MRTLNRSGFRVWSREDIAGILAAVDSANHGAVAAADTYESRLVRQGFVTALRSIARMFDVDYAPEGAAPPALTYRTIESTAAVRQ